MTDCEEVNVAHATVKMQCHVILTIDGIRWTNSSNKFWNHIVSSAVAILAQSHIKNCLPTDFGILQESWAYPGDLAVIRRQRTPRELSLSSKSWRSCWRRRQRHPVHDLQIHNWAFWPGWATRMSFTPKTHARFLHTTQCVLTLWWAIVHSSSYCWRCISTFGLQKSLGRRSRLQHVRTSQIISRQWWSASGAFLTGFDIRSYPSVGFVHPCATLPFLGRKRRPGLFLRSWPS